MGAGILNHGNATFSNLLIQRNTAESMGGGVYNTGSPLFHDVVISFNQAEKGAGFYNASTSSAPTLVNITVAANYRYELEDRSEEHTSELQSLMRISYAVFCLK